MDLLDHRRLPRNWVGHWTQIHARFLAILADHCDSWMHGCQLLVAHTVAQEHTHWNVLRRLDRYRRSGHSHCRNGISRGVTRGITDSKSFRACRRHCRAQTHVAIGALTATLGLIPHLLTVRTRRIFNQVIIHLVIIMKRRISLLLVGLVTGFSPLMVNGQVSLSAEIQVGPAAVQINSPSDFIQPLSTYGTWVDVAPYGRCWHPNRVAGDWQPYAYGQWVWTDAGWYWQSDEPWGWATCHYGSWINAPNYGWCWIPGTQWAPAWVTWRQSDDYVGWAPCGPNLTVLAPSFFLFTGIHDFGRAFRGRGDFIRDNPTIINRTRVINEFSTRTVNIEGREKRISYNRGPAVESVQRATGRTFQARPVQDVIRERHQPSNLHENRQQQEERNRLEQEQRPNRERQPQPGNPQSYQPTPNRSTRPGPQPVTPEQRQVQPTGREHGISTPPQQREVPNPAQPRTPNPTERPIPQPVTPREVPPTGQEHGISMPPQQREVPNPAQPRKPNPSERPMPQPVTPRQVPPTGQEHGISVPPQQREVPNPAQPVRPNRTVPSMPRPSAPPQRQIPPTGQEHGTSIPPQQREATRPVEASPKAEQSAPRQENAAQPVQPKQDGKSQGNQ